MSGGDIFNIGQIPENLPQESEAWYLVIRCLHAWLEIGDGSLARPNLMLLINLDLQMIVGVDISPNEPTPDQVVQFLYRAMAQPSRETGLFAHRPTSVIVEKDELAQAIANELEKIKIEVFAQTPPFELDQIVADMEDLLMGEQEIAPPGLLNIPDVEPETIASVFSACADFYRAAPWQHLSDAQPLAINLVESDERGFIQLMGNAGLEFGLVLFWDWRDLLHAYQQSDDPLDQLPPGGWRSLTFENADLLPWEDLEAINRYGWEIASEQAYPLILNYNREGIERPTRREIVIYEALLRSIPRFIETHLHTDVQGDYYPVEAEMEVRTIDGAITVRVAYPAGELPEVFTTPMEDSQKEAVHDVDLDLIEVDSFGETTPLNWNEIVDEIDIDSNLPQNETSLDAAKRIMSEARREADRDRRIMLAQKALNISPNCVEAYLLLAEEQSESLEDDCKLFRQGVEAGERVFDEQYFIENMGFFWGITETRPYMLARQGLADCLAQMGVYEDALFHYRELLALNPNDNQGVRYSLLALLIRLKRGQEAEALWERYNQDATAAWLYSRALLDFQRIGNVAQSISTLRVAFEANPHVPDLLTGRSPMPLDLPEYIRFGDESEAMHYVAENYMNWWGTHGAIEWLRDITSQQKQ